MMPLHRKLFAATALTVAAAAGTAAIAQITSTNVAFPRGATSTTVRGTLVGEQIRDYVVRASAGQVMRVSKTGSPIVYFNVMAPGSSGEAIFTGSTEGDRFSGTLSRGGPYTIRVYQMRATARRGERGSYALDIGVTGRGSAATQLPARPPAATGGGISGLRGMDTIRAIDVMTARGFVNVDDFSSGNTQYGIFYDRTHKMCAQMTMADGKVVSVDDIHTHPKCR